LATLRDGYWRGHHGSNASRPDALGHANPDLAYANEAAFHVPMNRVKKIVNHLEEGLMALFLATMTILTALQVLLRYAFNTGLLWSLEATTYCFAWLVLIGMAYCVRTRTHIALDLVVKRLADRTRRIVGVLAVAVSVVYSLTMFYGASTLVQRLFVLGHQAHDLPVARWMLSVILPFGFALLTLRLLQLALGIWRGQVYGLGFSENDPNHFIAKIELPKGKSGAGTAQ
jgi:C4-dicarboxylate transporter DctQ subunit